MLPPEKLGSVTGFTLPSAEKRPFRGSPACDLPHRRRRDAGLGSMALTESVAPRGSAFQARLMKESRQDAAPTGKTAPTEAKEVA